MVRRATEHVLRAAGASLRRQKQRPSSGCGKQRRQGCRPHLAQVGFRSAISTVATHRGPGPGAKRSPSRLGRTSGLRLDAAGGTSCHYRPHCINRTLQVQMRKVQSLKPAVWGKVPLGLARGTVGAKEDRRSRAQTIESALAGWRARSTQQHQEDQLPSPAGSENHSWLSGAPADYAIRIGRSTTNRIGFFWPRHALMASALCWAGAQAHLARISPQITSWQHINRRLAQLAPRQRPPACGSSSRRRPLPPASAATWQPPPGLSIMPWTGEPEQVAALEALRARMAASPYPEAAEDDATLRWFLQDRKLDVDEAEEKLLKMLRWRREFGCAEPTAEKAATGFLACMAGSRGHRVGRCGTSRERTGLSPHYAWQPLLPLPKAAARTVVAT